MSTPSPNTSQHRPYIQPAGELLAHITDLRHDLHKQPEVGLQLPHTQARVLEALEGLPLEITLGRTSTSITAVLRGTKDSANRPAVLLRGDMDALPIHEETDVPFASEVPGVMHACGHDTHTAMLTGAAMLLCNNRDELPGDVVFMFQPGEEGFDGAQHMLDEGVLEAAGSTVQAAYGLHVSSSRIPAGTFVTRSGPLMSASDSVHIRVLGRGGHGSRPQNTADPITAAAEMVLSIQALVTRRFDAFDPLVISIGMIRGGEAGNVIPDTVELKATVRTFSPENRERIGRLLPETLTAVAHAHGLEVDIDYQQQYPVTVNDEQEVDFVANTVREVFGDHRFKMLEDPLSGSEDFSRVLGRTPGAFVFLGAAVGDIAEETLPDNHSPRANFADGVLADGATLLAELAHRKLTHLAADRTATS